MTCPPRQCPEWRRFVDVNRSARSADLGGREEEDLLGSWRRRNMRSHDCHRVNPQAPKHDHRRLARGPVTRRVHAARAASLRWQRVCDRCRRYKASVRYQLYHCRVSKKSGYDILPSNTPSVHVVHTRHLVQNLQYPCVQYSTMCNLRML